MQLPPVAKVDWPKAYRLVSTKHPTIHLFEDIASPEDWELLISAEMKTNPRLAETIGNLDLIPVEKRVNGVGASYVMAPFTHISTDRPGRFHDGTFGAYYAANRFETALAEKTYHLAAFYRSTNEDAGWFVDIKELISSIDAVLHDLRDKPNCYEYLRPNDYGQSQNLATILRDKESDGIIYPSVRDDRGECIAAFWPTVTSLPVQGRILACYFDGLNISYATDTSTEITYKIHH